MQRGLSDTHWLRILGRSARAARTPNRVLLRRLPRASSVPPRRPANHYSLRKVQTRFVRLRLATKIDRTAPPSHDHRLVSGDDASRQGGDFALRYFPAKLSVVRRR